MITYQEAIEEAEARGAKKERDRIVEWLSELNSTGSEDVEGWVPNAVAEGEHWKRK